MFEKNDCEQIGLSHVAAQEASTLLTNIEKCKTDTKARKLRSDARLCFTEGRRKLRVLRDYINKTDKRFKREDKPKPKPKPKTFEELFL